MIRYPTVSTNGLSNSFNMKYQISNKKLNTKVWTQGNPFFVLLQEYLTEYIPYKSSNNNINADPKCIVVIIGYPNL